MPKTRTLPRSELPDVKRLLRAAKEIKGEDYLLFSTNGELVATGLDIDSFGCLRILMKHCSQIDWQK